MATLHEKTHQSKPKTHYSLSCFGLSRIPYTRNSSETMKSGRRRRIPSFSLFRLKERRSMTGKTVPLEAAPAVLEDEDNNFSATSRKSTSKSKSQPLAGDKLQQPLSGLKSVASDQTLDENDDTNWSEHVQKDNLDNGKSPQNSDSLKSSTYQTSESFGRRIEPIGTQKVISQPILPAEIIINPKPTKQSLSRPTLRPKPEKNPTADNSPCKKICAPMIGMFSLTLALLITPLWGKLCAIICTSAWLYILPHLRSSSELKKRIEERSQNLRITEMNSDLHRKKKVVFEGFLERSRRSRLGIHSHRMANLGQEDN